MNVNDGNGLFDSVGLIDSLLVDCNELPGALFNGRYVQFCSRLVQMVQKLSRLRDGVKSDIDSLQKQVEMLNEQNKEKGVE